jgi:hypothetical protein
MRRRDFVKAIIASAAGWPLSARAKQPTTKPVSPVLGQAAVDAFMAEELFGVAHPDQLLSFPGTLNPATQKLMKGGSEVSYQVDGSNIIVRAIGGIAAGSTHIWTIKPGARSVSSQVSVTDGGTYYQIENTLIAVRAPKSIPVPIAATWTTQGQGIIFPPSQVLAPIQGIRHRDGTWTGLGPNYLYFSSTIAYSSMGPPHNMVRDKMNFPCTQDGTVEILENGPLRAKIRMTYWGLRGSLGDISGGQPPLYAGLPSSDRSFFICTITVEAGQPVIMIEQDTDNFPAWNINMNTGVSADRARLDGFGCNSGDDPILGHNYDGSLYRGSNGPSSKDGEFYLSETGTRNGYDYAGFFNTDWDGVWYPRLDPWFSWMPYQGWYFHAYNSAGGSNSNVWGIFQGPASTYLNGGEARIGMYGKPVTGTPTEHGFYSFFCINAYPYIDYVHRMGRFGIFLGTKGTDTPVDFDAHFTLGDPLFQAGEYSTYPPGIQKFFNIHSGTAQFWKQISWGLDFDDPAGGFPGMYLNRADLEAIITAIKNDNGGMYGNGPYGTMCKKDPNYDRIWDAFNDKTNAAAAALAQWCYDRISLHVDIYVNRSSIHSSWGMFWGAALTFQSTVVHAQAMLSLNQVRPFLTDSQKRKLKSVISLMGFILWDNDFAPIDNYHGFNMGSANMPIQYAAARYQIASCLQTHPQFSAHFATILSSNTSLFLSAINAYGAPLQSPHYAGTTVIPTTDVFRQLQVNGYADVFAPSSSIHDRLTGLAEWCMQVLTPKQSRFGNLRKMVPYGDSTSEGHDHFLSLIMGFEAHDLTLSKRMAGAWAEMGRPLSSFYGSSALKIRPNFPTQDPALGDADFPGYMTVMRSGWGTANESAVFLLHGTFNFDHATYQRGSPSIYLLGAPVCIAFGSMYNVHVVGPWVSCSTYIPVSELGWAAGVRTPGHWSIFTDLNLPCGVHSNLFSDTYTYEPTTNQVDLACTFSVSGWIRHLTYYRDDLACPIVRLRDSNTAGESVFTLHMMATRAVTKPDGSTITPTTITGTPFSIANGACFKFVGQWGVSWDVYYFGPSAEAFIGVWINTWANGTEAGQYQRATGQAFQEKQYILRIKTMGPCDVVVVPYLTGRRPTGLNVVQVSGGLRVDPASRTLAN